MKKLFVTAALLILGNAMQPALAQEVTFTEDQVGTGAALYEEFCVECHGNNLDNGRFGTPLKGFFFENRWKGRSLGELARYTWEEMPEGNGKYLNIDEYVALVAYILEANGLESSATPMSDDFTTLDGVTLPF